ERMAYAATSNDGIALKRSGSRTAKPPGGMMFDLQAWLRAAAGFGATPVDSRRPMSEVTGPNTLTWPTAQSESRSAHGVVHWPTNTLPKPPWMPAAEFRDE